MYVKSFGYGTDTFAVMWRVNMLSCLRLPDIILQCGPEPSLIKWAESAKSKTEKRTVIRQSPQPIPSKQRSSGKLSETVAGTGAHKVGSNARPHADRPLTVYWWHGLFDTALGPFLVSRATMHSARSVGQWVVRSVEKWSSLVNLCLLALQRWEKDRGIPHRSWPTSGNPPSGWATATPQTNIWSEQMKELCTRQSYDESPSTAGQKKTFEHLSKHHRNRSQRHWTSLRQLTLLLLHLQYHKCIRTRRKNQQRSQPGGATRHNDDTWSFELNQSRDAHRNTGGHFREKAVDDEVINREANSHVCRRA